MLLWPVMPPPLCDGWAMLLDVSITNTTIMVVRKILILIFEKGMVWFPHFFRHSPFKISSHFLSASLLWPRARTIVLEKKLCHWFIIMRRTRALASSLTRMAGNGRNKNFSSNFSTAASEHVGYRSATPNDVTITQHTSSNVNNNKLSGNSTYTIHTNNESMELVDSLLLRTSEMMNPHAANVVAYSGGVDSSLVAALVHRVYCDYDNILSPVNSSTRGSVQAVLGISHAVPQTQIDVARKVADFIGIPLMEVSTAEGSDEAYIRNDGHACF
eukprot:scaffold32204_cov80-Skeletonema_marinoi.AAC.1